MAGKEKWADNHRSPTVFQYTHHVSLTHLPLKTGVQSQWKTNIYLQNGCCIKYSTHKFTHTTGNSCPVVPADRSPNEKHVLCCTLCWSVAASEKWGAVAGSACITDFLFAHFFSDAERLALTSHGCVFGTCSHSCTHNHTPLWRIW